MLHHSPLFLSLSSFSFFLHHAKHEALLTYCLISIYIPFICVSFVTYTNTACFYFIPLLCFISSFQCFVWILIRFRSVPLSLSLHSSTDPPPPPFHGTESVATPFLNFFIFLVFKIFLLKKCGMIYLHFVCVYVGTGCLHLGVVLCVVGLVFRVGWLCVVGWLCRVLNLYKLNISS